MLVAEHNATTPKNRSVADRLERVKQSQYLQGQSNEDKFDGGDGDKLSLNDAFAMAFDKDGQGLRWYIGRARQFIAKRGKKKIVVSGRVSVGSESESGDGTEVSVRADWFTELTGEGGAPGVSALHYCIQQFTLSTT